MKAREDLTFGQELVFQHIDVSVLEREGLQRIVNAKLFVLDFIDSPHAALTKKADYPVRTDFMSYGKGHSSDPFCRSQK